MSDMRDKFTLTLTQALVQGDNPRRLGIEIDRRLEIEIDSTESDPDFFSVRVRGPFGECLMFHATRGLLRRMARMILEQVGKKGE